MPRMSVRPRGKRIHELRSKMGIKQPQLAARARVNPRTITRVENNEATSLGTLEDLADEVRRQDREIGQTADVYSWGVILVEVLGGRLPKKPEDWPGVLEKANILKRVRKVGQKCLLRDWKKRPQTVDEILRAIQEWS